MDHKLLVTSFTTWRSEQKSNSADDLLVKIKQKKLLSGQIFYLRKLPVSFKYAPQRSQAAIAKLQPDAIIHCGMAESRQYLTVESRAHFGGQTLKTVIDIDQLIKALPATRISHNAGNFACNRLYFATMEYVHHHTPCIPCLFVHVPRLTAWNFSPIVTDFAAIVNRITTMLSNSN